MEKFKMYKLKWAGKVDESTKEVVAILKEIVKTCVDSHACGYDSWNVMSNCLGEIFISIVTIRKDSASDMIKWMEEKAGMNLKMKEIEVSPSLLKVENVAGESGERTISNSAGF